MSLPADLRRFHVPLGGVEVIIEDTGEAIVLRTLDEAVARTQALSRAPLASKGASVAGFLCERADDARAE